jgi:hypothetical protein
MSLIYQYYSVACFWKGRGHPSSSKYEILHIRVLLQRGSMIAWGDILKIISFWVDVNEGVISL